MPEDVRDTKIRALDAFNSMLYALVIAFCFEAFRGHAILSVQFILTVTLLAITIENFLTNYQRFTEVRGSAFDESIVILNYLHLVFVYKCIDYLRTDSDSGRDSLAKLETPEFWVSAALLYVVALLHSIRTKQEPFIRFTLLRLLALLCVAFGGVLFNGGFAPYLGREAYFVYTLAVFAMVSLAIAPRWFDRGLVMLYGDSAIELKTYARARDIDWSVWDEIRPKNSHITEKAYMLAVEESQAVQCEHQYLEFRRDGEVLCIMPAFAIDNDFAMFATDGIRRLVGRVRKLFPRFLREETLEVGSPLGLGSVVGIRDGATKSELFTVLSMLKRHCLEQRIGLVLIRDLRGQRGALDVALEQSGFRMVPNVPDAILEVDWESFEDYLHDLKPRYRQSARRKLRQFAASGIAMKLHRKCPSDLSSYVELYQSVRDNAAQNTRERIGAEYHRSMARNLGEDSMWLEYTLEDRIVGFVHVVKRGERLVSEFIGMNYAIARASSLYFQTYYDLTKLAIALKCRTLHFGITAYEAKSEIGCSIVPQRLYAWHKSRAILWILARTFSALTRYDVARCHSVFVRERQRLWDGRKSTAFG